MLVPLSNGFVDKSLIMHYAMESSSKAASLNLNWFLLSLSSIHRTIKASGESVIRIEYEKDVLMKAGDLHQISHADISNCIIGVL